MKREIECPIQDEKELVASMNRLKEAGLIEWEEAGKDENGHPVFHITLLREEE